MRPLRLSTSAALIAVLLRASSASAATIDVTTTTDVIDGADGLCSLREAITAANSDTAFSGCTAGSGADTITLHAGTYAVALPGADDGNASGDFDVTSSITFVGAGAALTTVHGGGLDRVFDFQSPGGPIDCAIGGVTITGGNTPDGGGAIRANVPAVDLINVIVTDSLVQGNTAQFGGATIVSPGAMIQLERCLVLQNTASYVGGASYGTYGTTRFINSTVAQNSAPFAGAISVFNARVEISGSTITDNSATNPGFNPNDGNSGGILVSVQFNWGGYRALFIADSIVSGNHWPSDPYDADIACNRLSGDSHVVSGGYNTVGTPGTQFFGCRRFAGQQGGYWDGANNDEWGVVPQLGPLADNGGPTSTYALLPGPGVGNGTCTAIGGGTLAVDQRGVTRPRPAGSSCDRGAYERGACGDGTLEAPEVCDNGNSNSDTVANACRTTCVAASCGDGVTDTGEVCDTGTSNSNSLPDACRTSCVPASCGDGVVDTGEACDWQTGNSNTTPDACRTTCALPKCGDSVTDSGEECDTGGARSDTLPDACRTSCAAAACGDSVVDTGEACDTGSARSDTTPNACRTSCALPTCGDSVVDTGEACDTGSARSDTTPNACRTGCALPTCGDNVVDNGEECDTGGARSDTVPNACRTSCRTARCGDSVIDLGEECDLGSQNGLGTACTKSCTVAVIVPDAGTDAGSDSGADAGSDSGTDANADAAGDGAVADGAVDAATDGAVQDGSVDATTDGAIPDGAVADATNDGATNDGGVQDGASEAGPDGGVADAAHDALADSAPTEDGGIDGAVTQPHAGDSGDDSGCGCRTAGSTRGTSGALALVAIAGLVVARRSRRADRSRRG